MRATITNEINTSGYLRGSSRVWEGKGQFSPLFFFLRFSALINFFYQLTNF